MEGFGWIVERQNSIPHHRPRLLFVVNNAKTSNSDSPLPLGKDFRLLDNLQMLLGVQPSLLPDPSKSYVYNIIILKCNKRINALPCIRNDHISILNCFFWIFSPTDVFVASKLFHTIPHRLWRAILERTRNAQLVAQSRIRDKHIVQYVRRITDISNCERWEFGQSPF